MEAIKASLIDLLALAVWAFHGSTKVALDALYLDPVCRPVPANQLEVYHPASKEFLIISSDFLFSILQLLICDPTRPGEINGFKIIKEKAIKQNRYFPFESPRQLFVGICHSMAVHDFLLDISTNPEDQRKKYKSVRRNHSILEQKLMDDNLKPREEEELLEQKLQDDWFEFWDAAIHPHRYEIPIEPYFLKFRKAHKEMKKLFNSNPIKGTWSVYGIRDRNGNFIDPESGGLLEGISNFQNSNPRN